MNNIKERLKQIRERERVATRGPWQALEGVPIGHPIRARALFEHADHERMVITYRPKEGQPRSFAGDDLLFIASARDDIPWLLERLQKAEDILRSVREQERLSDFSDEMIDTFLGN